MNEQLSLLEPEPPQHRPTRRRRQTDRRGVEQQRFLLTLILPIVALLFLFLFLGARTAARRPASAPENRVPTVSWTAERIAEPTPIFARCGDLMLNLPVPAKSVTAIAFHQAAKDYALHMTSLILRPASASATSAGNGPYGTQDAEIEGAEAMAPKYYQGRSVRLWRTGRKGIPDSAVDVGGRPGTIVVSPVTGKVTEVRPYKLYGQWDDYEIHIRPTNRSDIDVVLIHVDDVAVQPGVEVTAGETGVAHVRWLSKDVALQLANYSRDSGNHVHLQVNSLPAKTLSQPASGNGPADANAR